MKKYVLFDIDGTLIDNKKYPENVENIKELVIKHANTTSIMILEIKNQCVHLKSLSTFQHYLKNMI